MHRILNFQEAKKFFKKSILHNKLEVLALAIGILIFIFLSILNYRSYIFLSLAPVIGIILFIVFKKTFHLYDITESFQQINRYDEDITQKILLIVFFVFYSASLLTILDGFYTKTLYYYFCISICAGIIVTEILFLNSKQIWKSNLLMSLLLFLNLTLTNQILFPLQIGNPDNFYHIRIISAIIENGYIPLGYTYSNFPMHHLLAGISNITTSISLSEIYHCLGAAIMALGVLFSFLIGRKFVSVRFGLLAALLYCCSDYLIYWAAHPVQLSYMLPIIIILFSIVLYNIKYRSPSIIILYLILSLNLVFLHHYSAIIMAFVLCGVISAELIYKTQHREHSIRTKSLFLIYILILLTHFIYYSGQFNNLIGIIDLYQVAFTSDVSTNVVSGTYYDKLPMRNLVTNTIGSFMLFCLSTIGFFYYIREKSFFGMVVSAIFAILLLLIAIGTVINIYYLLPNRIYGFMQELSMIFLSAAAIIWILSNTTREHVKYGIILIIVILQFFSASSTIAGFETSLFAGEQPYWKFYETPQEKNSLLWVDDNFPLNSKNDSFYRNPGFVTSPETSSLISLKYDKYSVTDEDNKIVVDLNSIPNNSYFSFSEFDISIGFMHQRVSEKYHMGSGGKIKMDRLAQRALDDNSNVVKLYNNGIISAHHRT